jgi:tetratricopeptide (TPR) repeat protein
MWFERGENAESLAETLSIDEDDDGDAGESRRSGPTLAWISGSVAVLLVSFCEVLTHVAHASRVSNLPSLAIADPTQKTALPEPTPLASLPPAQIASAPVPAQPSAAPMQTRPTAAPVAASAPRLSRAPVTRRSAKARVVARVAKISPDVVAGEKLLRQGRAALALRRFQQQIGRSLDDVRALRGACLAIADLGRLNEAARVCRRALDCAPEDLTTRRSLATIYYNGGAYKWSAAEWRQVVAQDPKDQHAKKALRAAEARS